MPTGLSTQQVSPDTTEENDGSTHTHNGVPHTHPLPATGLNHTHNYNTRPATSGINNAPAQPPKTSPPIYRPPVVRPPVTRPPVRSNAPAGPNQHYHDGRAHSHPLPASGTNHRHNMGGQQQRHQQPARPAQQPVRRPQQPAQRPPQNYMAQPPRPAPRPASQQPVRTQTYDYSTYGANTVDTNVNYVDYTKPSSPPRQTAPAARPAPVAPKQPASYYDFGTVSAVKQTGLIAHSHNGKQHSHVLPSTGRNHRHNMGSSLSDTYRKYAMGGQDNSAPSYSAKTSPSTGSYSSGGGSSSGATGYVVQKGDTVFQVMRNTGVYWKDIIRLNSLKAPGYTIHPGQRLRLK